MYQRLFAIIPSAVFEPIHDLTTIKGCFYGFHDKIPWSNDNIFLLAHRYDTTRTPKQAETLAIDIGVVENQGEFRRITQSKCWNWQQGSMLQWLGKDGLFAFNDYNQEECIKIYNTHGEKIKEISGHLGAAHPEGKTAIGFSFGRLKKATEEYGYNYFNACHIEKNNPAEDGLWLIDIDKNRRHLIVSLETLSKKDSNHTMKTAYHYVTHTTYSESGNNYVFLHRWKSNTGILYSRLYIGDTATNTLRYFPIFDTSHISWDGNDRLFIYGWLSKNNPCYISLCAKTLTATPVHLGIPNVDGHPQVHNNGLVVTDSYPNRSRLQSLYVCNLVNGDCYLLQKTKIPFRYRLAMRCDFHPRWDRTGTKICFDSASSGIRSLCIIGSFSTSDKKYKRISYDAIKYDSK
jgi:hypothetical protein